MWKCKGMEEGSAEQLLSAARLWGHFGAPRKRKRDGNLPPLLICESFPVLVSVACNLPRVNKGLCVLFASVLNLAPSDHRVKILK